MPDTEALRPHALEGRRVRAGLLAVAGIGAAAGLAVALVSGGRAMLDGLARLPLATAAAAVGLNLASWLGEAVVFASLASGARGKGGPRTGARGILRMVAVYVGGGFPALVTPFGSGGIPGWVYALTGEGLSAGEAAAVVGARGLLTSLFFVAAGAVALAAVPARASGSLVAAAAGLGALVAVFGAVMAAVARPRMIARALERILSSRPVVRLAGTERARRLAAATSRETELFAGGLRSLARDRPWAVVGAVAGLAFSRACLLAIMPVIMTGLGWRGGWLPVIGIVVAVQALASGSPTPGGSGAVEAALTVALTAVAPVATAGTAALLWRGITFYLDLGVGWALFARRVASSRPVRPESNEGYSSR